MITAVVATCALVDNGSNATEQKQTVTCWGTGFALGVGTSSGNASSAVNVNVGDDVLAIDAGKYHTCLVNQDDQVHCWGCNGNGQIGNGTAGGFVYSPTLVNH